MAYHSTVANLYQRFTATTRGLSASELENAVRIREAAKRHLETLIRIYYLRHGFDSYGGGLSVYIVQLGLVVLKKLNSISVTGPSSTRHLGSLEGSSASSEGMLHSGPSPIYGETVAQARPSGANVDAATLNSASTTAADRDLLAAVRSTILLLAKGLHDQGQSAYMGKARLRTLVAMMAPLERQLLAQILGHAASHELDDTDSNVEGIHSHDGHGVGSGGGIGRVSESEHEATEADSQNMRIMILPRAIPLADHQEANRVEELAMEQGRSAGRSFRSMGR